MVLAQCCDVCGNKFVRDISKFCAICGEKRIKEVVEEEEDLEVGDEGSMRGPPARVAMREKSVNTMSYTQIFAPPVCRNKNKKYGKKALLAAKMDIQHRIMLDNYEQVKKWLVDAQKDGRLPQGAFSLEEEGVQDNLRQIIKENCPTLQELKLGRKNHKWDEREIYKFLKHHLRYLRRKNRNLEKLTRIEVNEEEEVNEGENSSRIEENRNFFLMDTVENMEMSEATIYGEGEADVLETEPSRSIEDDESFLLLVLSLPTVDIMKRHLIKVIEELNAKVKPKPFGVGYRKWDKEKRVTEVANYYRKKSSGTQVLTPKSPSPLGLR